MPYSTRPPPTSLQSNGPNEVPDEGTSLSDANIAATRGLIYRTPEPSRATRKIPRRSKASLRGSMVAKLPGFERPRVLWFESAHEYRFLCQMLVREDVFSIWDQPPAISYVDGRGRKRGHTFDFLVTLQNGERIAVAIKPSIRALSQNFIAELEMVAVSMPKQYADRIVLITEKHIDREAAAEAARQLTRARMHLSDVVG